MTKIPGNYQYKALHTGNPIQRQWHRAKMLIIEHVAPPMPNSRVLDAACGSGVISDFLCMKGAQVVGVDINEDAISFAKKTFKRRGLHFEHASIFDIDGPPFDGIYCLEAIEHFAHQELKGVLAHFKGLLRPNGALFLTTPNYASAWPVIEWCLDTFGLAPRLKGDQHLSKLTPRGLKRLLEESGWHIVEMGTFNGIAPFCATISNRLSHWLYQRELRLRTRLTRNLIYALATPAKNG